MASAGIFMASSAASGRPVRTRIAPSPTGDPHLGTAYVALFNRCFAHRHGGSFVLRIEDTDRERSSERFERGILDALGWLGLDWDEGPGRDGGNGPYRQSERGGIYAEKIRVLLEKGHAFHCFCDENRLSKLRSEQMRLKLQPGYDGHCLGLSKEEVAARLSRGERHVIRLRVPREGDCVFADLLRGEIRIDWPQIDMAVLIKSDGMPTYHFANVVDDHLMGISHVIRGEEWISSVPKHVLLYDCFGWERPVFCHLPLLRNPDKSKLSKRRNPTGIGYYQAMGYLPEALVNYLGNMGWSLPGGEEKFSQAEMRDNFELERISLGGPIFDRKKLDWLNGRYLRENLDDAEFARAFAAWAFQAGKIGGIAPLVRQRVGKFSDVSALAGFLLQGDLALSAGDFSHQQLDADSCRRILQFSLWALENTPDFSRDAIEARLRQLAEKMDLKIRNFLFPLFVAISGRAVSLSVYDAIAAIGPDLARARLRGAIEALGGISNKQQKKLEKEFRLLRDKPAA